MTVLDESEQMRLYISVPDKIIEKMFNISVCNATKAEVILKFMNKTFNFTLSRKGNTCLDMSYLLNKKIDRVEGLRNIK